MNVKSKMYDYITETPTVLNHIIENRKVITKSFVNHFSDVPLEQIYILGSGTSYHAGLAVKAYVEEILQIKVMVMYPTQFERNEQVFNKSTLVIGVSQGGQSLSTIAGLDSASIKGLHTAAVSENPSALIFEHAMTSTEIEVGNEQCGAKTKGYSGTIMTLMLMMTELSLLKGNIDNEQSDAYIVRMKKVIENIGYVIVQTTDWYNRISRQIGMANRIIVIGYESTYANVLEGALKILETVRIGVEGYDIEEFFHGIYNSINSSTHIFYLASKGDYKPRTIRLREILKEWTEHHYLITSPDDVDVQSGNDLFCDFCEDPLFSVWEYIIPLQIVACLASLEQGINPDIPKDPSFHERIGSKVIDSSRDMYVLEE